MKYMTSRGLEFPILCKDCSTLVPYPDELTFWGNACIYPTGRNRSQGVHLCAECYKNCAEYREKVKVKTYKYKKIDPSDKNPAYKELTKKSKEEEDLFERIYNKPNGKKQEKTYKKGPKSEKDLIEEFVNSVADDDSITIDDMNNWLAWQGGNFSED